MKGTRSFTLRALRLQRRVPQHRLASACGVDPSDLRKWERGLEVPPDSSIRAFAEYFGVSRKNLRHAALDLCGTASAGEGYVTAQPARHYVDPRRIPPPAGRLKVLDLFCGAGGFSFGLEMTGKFAVTAGIDLLPDRMSTFAANHNYADSISHDIRKISVEDLCAHAQTPDVVVGGPPCQGFSSIRPYRKLTEDDPRNNLFESFVVTVAQARPRWFVLENVVGLIQHKRQAAFRAMLEGFESIGYSTDWRVLNSAFYGLPQYRERVVVVGSRDGERFHWPDPTHQAEFRSMVGKGVRSDSVDPLFVGELLPAVTAIEAISDLPEIAAGEAAVTYKSGPKNSFQALMRGGGSKLTLHEATRHSEKMLEIIRHSGASRSALPKGLTTSGFSSSYSRIDPHRPSVTLTVNFVHPSSNKCIHPYQDRALTPREGARLQGFPDTFKFVGTRSRIVKQIGNAVPPLLGRAIGKALLQSMS